MDTQHRTLQISPRLAAGLAAIVLTSGGLATWWTLNHPPESAIGPSSSSPTAPTDDSAQTPQLTAPAVEQTVTLYWLQDTGRRLELTEQTVEVQSPTQPEAILTATFTALFTGPEGTTVATTIPTGTTLLDVAVEADGVHVNLSDQFTTGGGSASMGGRLGQVIYTASSLDPTAPVWIAVEGEPLTVLGGEGLRVNQPMTRAQFTENFDL